MVYEIVRRGSESARDSTRPAGAAAWLKPSRRARRRSRCSWSGAWCLGKARAPVSRRGLIVSGWEAHHVLSLRELLFAACGAPISVLTRVRDRRQHWSAPRWRLSIGDPPAVVGPIRANQHRPRPVRAANYPGHAPVNMRDPGRRTRQCTLADSGDGPPVGHAVSHPHPPTDALQLSAGRVKARSPATTRAGCPSAPSSAAARDGTSRPSLRLTR